MSLIPARAEYTLRELDETHVEALKNQLVSRAMFLIAKGVTDDSEFDDKDLDFYELEVIGGNHWPLLRVKFKC